MPVDLSDFKRHVARIRSTATAKHYCASVSTFLAWVEKTYGRIAINTLPRTALIDYAQSLQDAANLRGTIEAHLAAINRYFRWLHERENVKFPKFHTVELPKETRKVKDILSPEMLTHFFRVARSTLHEPLRTAVMLLPCSGLRSNEMATLSLFASRRSPFKMADGTVKETTCLFVKGKGGHERIVPLLDEGAELLLGYKKWRKEHGNPKYMFPGRDGDGHISTRAIRDAVQKIRGAFKMNFTPHTMRRTYLTSLYRKGVDPTMLAKIAGHKNVQILVDHYLALDEHDVVSAVHKTGGKLTTSGGRDGNRSNV